MPMLYLSDLTIVDVRGSPVRMVVALSFLAALVGQLVHL